MENLRWGVLLGSLLAGPKLWSLVSAGDLSGDTAMIRWAAVVAACTAGVAGIRRISADYETQSRAAAAAAEEALREQGERVVLEGTTLPAPSAATPPPPPVTRPPV